MQSLNSLTLRASPLVPLRAPNNVVNRRVAAAKRVFFVFATAVPNVSALQRRKDLKRVFFVSALCLCLSTTSRVITRSSLPERVASPSSIASTRLSFPPVSAVRFAASPPRATPSPKILIFFLPFLLFLFQLPLVYILQDSEPNIIDGVWLGLEESH
ncbi:hypothetical protein V8G54_003777 [Vigna mungo]|uniref:Transmembrane protein n=1 Tax=Vigna mungo TaxID=3915 RepID=A0AAQ3SDF6_VIGMU